MTQERQVVEALRAAGGYATLRRLNEMVDFAGWRTRTPEASVRRIVQESREIFRIRPGLWALESCRDEVLHRLDLREGDERSEERFSHAYYQGLLVEMGHLCDMTAFVPAQDGGRLFLGAPLREVADGTRLPHFTYDALLRRARMVDVVWLNRRGMPSAFYEVEHTTDMRNALSKFYELQDFHADFYIVADESRRAEFEDKLHATLFLPIQKRVCFRSYDKLVRAHESLKGWRSVGW